MQLEQTIRLSSVLGLTPLEYSVPESSGSRRIKIYTVPKAVSTDGYFIAITPAGATEIIPPSRGNSTTLLADYTLVGNGDTTIHFIHEEVRNA